MLNHFAHSSISTYPHILSRPHSHCSHHSHCSRRTHCSHYIHETHPRLGLDVDHHRTDGHRPCHLSGSRSLPHLHHIPQNSLYHDHHHRPGAIGHILLQTSTQRSVHLHKILDRSQMIRTLVGRPSIRPTAVHAIPRTRSLDVRSCLTRAQNDLHKTSPLSRGIGIDCVYDHGHRLVGCDTR